MAATNLILEAYASNYWCPFSMAGTPHIIGINRQIDASDPLPSCRCLGGNCTVWRWVDDTHGYCGLAGLTQPALDAPVPPVTPAAPATQHFNTNAHGNYQVFSGAGHLLGVDVGQSGGTGEALSLYDSVGATTGLIIAMDASTGRSFNTYSLPIANGLYVTLLGAGQSASVAIWYTVG